MMFVFLFPVIRRRACARLVSTVLACLHVVSLAAVPRARIDSSASPMRRSQQALHATTQMAARAALRTVHAGHPLTPTGYVLLGAALIVAALASLICSPCANDPERPLRSSRPSRPLRPRFRLA
jgi:hypothetical protein